MFKRVSERKRRFEAVVNKGGFYMTFVIAGVEKIGNVCGYDSGKKRRIFLIFG